MICLPRQLSSVLEHCPKRQWSVEEETRRALHYNQKVLVGEENRQPEGFVSVVSRDVTGSCMSYMDTYMDTYVDKQ